MKVLTVEQYNKQQEEKYKKAVADWDYKKGGFPCRAMYLFLDEKGFTRTEGFVAVDDIRAICRPTEIGVKRVYNKLIKKGY